MWVEVNCLHCSKLYDKEVDSSVAMDLVGTKTGHCQPCINYVTKESPAEPAQLSPKLVADAIIDSKVEEGVTAFVSRGEESDPKAIFKGTEWTINDRAKMLASSAKNPSTQKSPSEMDLEEYGNYLKANSEKEYGEAKLDRNPQKKPFPCLTIEEAEKLYPRKDKIECGPTPPGTVSEIPNEQWYVGVAHPSIANELANGKFKITEGEDEDEPCAHDVLENDHKKERLICQDCDLEFTGQDIAHQLFFQGRVARCEHKNWQEKDFGHFKECGDCGHSIAIFDDIKNVEKTHEEAPHFRQFMKTQGPLIFPENPGEKITFQDLGHGTHEKISFRRLEGGKAYSRDELMAKPTQQQIEDNSNAVVKGLVDSIKASNPIPPQAAEPATEKVFLPVQF